MTADTHACFCLFVCLFVSGYFCIEREEEKNLMKAVNQEQW